MFYAEIIPDATWILDGKEREDEYFFAYSATLRIAGQIPDMDDITAKLALDPTHSHRMGEKHGPKSAPFPSDMWCYTPRRKNRTAEQTHRRPLAQIETA